MLDVVIAVEEPLVRLGLRAALDAASETRVVAALEGVAELASTLERFPSSVLILDVRFRRVDGSLIPGIARRFPQAHVLVYVAHTSEECVVRHLLAAGGRAQLSREAICKIDECCLTSLREQAHGCLPAEASAAEVVRAVTAVAAGEIVAAPWLAAANRLGFGDTRGEKRAITPRELDVMALVAEGLGNKAIAKQLGIKEQTVKNHLARLMDKMGLSNRVQVGLIASRYDLTVVRSGS